MGTTILKLVLAAAVISLCACGGGQTPVAAATEPAAAVASDATVASVEAAPSEALAPPPWITHALKMDSKVYALHGPTEGAPPGSAKEVDVMDAFIEARLESAEPVADGTKVTLFDRGETCVGSIAAKAWVYLKCPGAQRWEKRLGQRVDGCSWFETDEAANDPLAIQGDVDDLAIAEIPSSPRPDEERTKIRRAIGEFVSALPGAEAKLSLGPIAAIRRIPGASFDLVNVVDNDDPGRGWNRVFVVGDAGAVVRMLPVGYDPVTSYSLAGRTYVGVATRWSCGVTYEVQAGDLVPYNDDCVSIYCGDGEF